MADDLKPIADYHITDWHNYLPPSIDQVNLNKLEEGMALNRNTINEIIRHLGVKPESISSEDEKIGQAHISDNGARPMARGFSVIPYQS